MGARILLVVESSALRERIRAVLEAGLSLDELIEAEDGRQGFDLLVQQRPDLVICDLATPSVDGLALLAQQRSRAELADVPVLMLIAEAELSRTAEVLGQGAADYVVVPFADGELVARVRLHDRVRELQDELRQANARLDSLVTTDALTGLYNRSHLGAVLFHELRRTLRYGAPLSIIVIDVERGSAGRDTSAVVRDVAALITQQARATDVAAWGGGEEIVLVLPHTDARGAGELAERLRQRIDESIGLQGDGVKSASFGIATHPSGASLLDPEELLRQASEALGEAKRGDGNRVAFWSQ